MKKFTCYDCIHCGACSSAGDSGFSCLKDDVSKCKHFKNTADFVEVKHGHWLDNIEKTSTVAGITKDFAIGYKCSLCGRTEINREPYCNCGAKMVRGDAE